MGIDTPKRPKKFKNRLEYYNWLSGELENIVAKTEMTVYDRNIILYDTIKAITYLYMKEEFRIDDTRN